MGMSKGIALWFTRLEDLIFLQLMMRHKNTEDASHPEQPARIERIYECIKDFGILDRKGK